MKNMEERLKSSIAFQPIRMKTDLIIQKLRENGCRITKQRRILLDIIMENDCTCCKEIYYRAIKEDDSIGVSTVYRMINTLEEIGAISRNDMYQVVCSENCELDHMYRIIFEDGSCIELSEDKWNQVVAAGLKACGCKDEKKICSISNKTCNCRQKLM